ncbi:hypothetical protein GCM10010387_60500 [Streptomyces inusitatus]|uniref:Uncharacterized protein n=1 Tax=Streptomyces inusitatus TaxID=68221 RepID=A0A918QLF8_9ACTN|nr:hypothetical protein [Streptomyces inusitatus]GGZ58509.1 hypothetical protein GCM10010387_60500 [Streptomyces inusitatus]
MSLGDDHGYRSDPGGRGDDGFGGTGQTRTRLPGTADTDAHGGPRRPARGSRSLITVVGVVVLLIAAIAFANRGDTPDTTTSTPGSPANRPGTHPTAPTGVKPVQGHTQSIPTGHPKTEQGAQSAAANYAVALGSDGMFKTAARENIVRTVHDPATVERLLTDLDKAYSPGFLAGVGLEEDGTAPKGLSFISRTVPVGTSVTEQKGDMVTVEVWCTGLIGLAGPSSVKPVTENWFTLTQKLRWVDNDWKIVSSTQKEGPTPVYGDNRASSADEIASAVAGYGGFTYAR